MTHQNDSESPQPVAEEKSLVGVASTDLFSVYGYGEYANFRLTVTERSDHAISGDIEEITAWECDDAHTPCDSEHYMSFYMKWDGCCHVWFGEKLDDKTHDGYLHLCGADSWDKHIALMRWLYKWAAAAIPMDKDVAGDLSENAAHERPANNPKD